MKRKIIPYNPKLKFLARRLRKNMTYGEVKLWMCLKGKKMKGYDFHRQKPIGNYIVDFYSCELKLAIEVDGSSHDDERWQKDMVRQKELESFGVRFLRFTEYEVLTDIDGVWDRIYLWIEENV